MAKRVDVGEEAETLASGIGSFVSLLRATGIDVSIRSAMSFADALLVLGPSESGSAGAATTWYWAARVTLLTAPEQLPTFDAAWAAWLGASLTGAPLTSGDDAGEPAGEHAGEHAGEPAGEHAGDAHPDTLAESRGQTVGDLVGRDSPPLSLPEWPSEFDDNNEHWAGGFRSSAQELLRTKDFATMTDDEQAELHRMMAAMRVTASHRPSRRRRAQGRSGHRSFDLRATVRAAAATEGELLTLATRRRTTRSRRVVMLVDISGSMEAYARPLLRFAHIVVGGSVARSGSVVEAFSFGTRLTRLTRELSSRDADAAMTKAAAAVADWSGGTRLGASLQSFNDQWGTNGMARGAVVVIVSDGWDCGDPAELAAQMVRLRRVAHRVIWVNPLKATPGYAPLAAGMAAALPHIDAFVEGHDLASLERLSAEIARAAVSDRRPATTRAIVSTEYAMAFE